MSNTQSRPATRIPKRTLLAALVLTLAIGACGSDEPSSGGANADSAAKELTIYSSLPLQGAARAQESRNR